MKESTTTRPYKTLDAWRGIASIWVVMFHVSEMVVFRYPALRSQPIYCISLLGGLGVQMFFVISGYCVVNSACSTLHRENSVRHFLKARARRIYPPFWFASLLALILFVTAQAFVAHGQMKGNTFTEQDYFHNTFLYYVTNISLTQIAFRQRILLGVSWTLCYELAFYLIIGLSMLTAKSAANERKILTTLHTVTFVSLILLICAPNRSFYPFDLWPQFGLGVLVWDMIRRPQHIAPRMMFAVVAFEILLLCLLHNVPIGYLEPSCRQTFIASLIFAILILMLHPHDQQLLKFKVVKLFSSVGIYSYSLYLTHTLTMRVINQLALAVRLPQSYHYFLFALALVLSMVTGYVFFRQCEQPFLTIRNLAKQRLQST